MAVSILPGKITTGRLPKVSNRRQTVAIGAQRNGGSAAKGGKAIIRELPKR